MKKKISTDTYYAYTKDKLLSIDLNQQLKLRGSRYLMLSFSDPEIFSILRFPKLIDSWENIANFLEVTPRTAMRIYKKFEIPISKNYDPDEKANTVFSDLNVLKDFKGNYLIGRQRISNFLNVHPKTVNRWIKRYRTFPVFVSPEQKTLWAKKDLLSFWLKNKKK